ncbi:hypothetical protein BO78DRAFT_171200 [Aspergillus sclerotiicarbonarius CBS 121057]|uniref:Uncharacterized protein n=1 Tax=Aspergillus sclerotiicarbonarius (strain CBS 121057 / IBT 28362) TaxID=1448318 RepID=A0A319FDD1_ASPSB|nr:hypothetical protein BO78DRAFT_171200 [Aspergillus sclerotiicarbonarius CBS 121057]
MAFFPPLILCRFRFSRASPVEARWPLRLPTGEPSWEEGWKAHPINHRAITLFSDPASRPRTCPHNGNGASSACGRQLLPEYQIAAETHPNVSSAHIIAESRYHTG